jgi:Domain of unknown function (DUF4170)
VLASERAAPHNAARRPAWPGRMEGARMADELIYYVWGGVFQDMSFGELKPDTEESYGPFHDEATAKRVWQARTGRNVDIAQHRLFVLKIPRPH